MKASDRVPGFSLLEALLALMLLTIVIPSGWTILIRHRAAGMRVAQRAEALETVRTVAWLLPEEVSKGRQASDWSTFSGDSLRLRAFRGMGLVKLGSVQGGRMQVCCLDVRAPAPEKDSVLLLGSDGRWRTHDLVDRRAISEGCPGLDGGREEEWDISPPPTDGILARVFETGTYYFADGALRYRRGEGGRQPLTPERIDLGRFLDNAGGGVPFAWQIVLRGALQTLPDSGKDEVLSWRGGGW